MVAVFTVQKGETNNDGCFEPLKWSLRPKSTKGEQLENWTICVFVVFVQTWKAGIESTSYVVLLAEEKKTHLRVRRLSNKKTNKNKPLITMYLNFLRLHCLKYWLRNVSCEGPPGFQWLLFTNVYGWIGIILFDPTITGSIFITSAMSWHTLHHPLLWAVSVSIFTRSYVYYHTSQCFCGQRKVMLWRGQ